MKPVRVFQLGNGKSPLILWLESLDKAYKTKVEIYITRLALGGSKKNRKPITDKIEELKIFIGSGLRVYFVEFDEYFLLLYGGDKSSQKKDIKIAKQYWSHYGRTDKL